MSDYTVKAFSDAPDVLGEYPGEMHFLRDVLETEQVSVTYRRMPPETGGKGGYGHRHVTQEEVCVVLSGTLQFKIDDEIIDVPAKHAVRIAPQAARSVWNASETDAELLIVSTRIEDLRADTEFVEDFWPV
jgi:uncharacterized cupin superfamily protein